MSNLEERMYSAGSGNQDYDRGKLKGKVDLSNTDIFEEIVDDDNQEKDKK